MPLPGSFDIQRAVQALHGGELVAFPTETVFGLGAAARDEAALQALYDLKGRPAAHPVIVHLGDAGLLTQWAQEVPRAAQRLADSFWPGPLTLILQRRDGVSDRLTGGQETVGLRVPSHPVAQALLRAFGDGVAAPSANRFGHISPTRADHVRAEFPHGIAVILDGPPGTVGIESTIVDCRARPLRLLRPGSVSPRQLEAVAGCQVIGADSDDAPRVSGSLPRHYAPRVPAYLVEGGALDDVLREITPPPPRPGVLGFGRRLTSREALYRDMPRDPHDYALALYAALHDLELACDLILVEAPPASEAWHAIRDRLWRACSRFKR